MGLVYLYKRSSCMLGADVSMLLNLQPGRLLIAIVERGHWASIKCSGGLSGAEKPGIGGMAGTCQVDLSAAPARACFGRNPLPAHSAQVHSPVKICSERMGPGGARTGEHVVHMCSLLAPRETDLSPLVPNTTTQPLPGMATIICRSEDVYI